ncbi:MAG TPA: DUF4831 family protein [Kofleriaceae bacterium]|nr:DUF4831 family protein [Kofleriaceae bacterium]
MPMVARVSALVLITISVSCASGMRVHRVTDKTPSEKTGKGRYLIYSLPKATITVDLPITRTVRDLGSCAKQGILDTPWPTSSTSPARTGQMGAAARPAKEQGVPTANAVSKPATVKDRLQELGIEPHETPASKIEIGDAIIGVRMDSDPDQVFAIRLDSKVLDSKKLGLELSEEGVLSSASFESSNKLADITVKTITNAASVISGALALAGPVDPVDHCIRVVRRIEELRAKREALVTGGASSTNGVPKEALDLMLAELRGLEETYVAEFSGTKTVQKTTARCEWSPDSKKAEIVTDSHHLLSFSNARVSQAAVCLVSEIFKQPFKLDSGVSPNEEPIKTVYLSLTGRASLARAAVRYEPPTKEESGLYFRVPVRVTASLYVATDERVRSRMDIPQYGEVVSLPGHGDVKSASLAVTAKFGPAGGLTSLSHAVTPVDVGAAIDAAGTATKATLDAVKARRNADIEDLEREKKRLELKRDIQKLQEVEAPAE